MLPSQDRIFELGEGVQDSPLGGWLEVAGSPKLTLSAWHTQRS
jgi:hypothetical protein